MWSPSNRQTHSVTLRGFVELPGVYGMNTVGILPGHVQRCSLLVATYLILSTTVAKAEPITEQQAHAIGVDAYLYFYSLVTMDLTRRQLTNVETGKGFGGPMNTFANVPAYPTAQDRPVVRPNIRYPLFVGVA
jgi:hypothetical protein